MTSLRYKFMEFTIGLFGLKKRLGQALETENIASHTPPFYVRSRWVRSQFQTYDVWRCDPKSGPSKSAYLHEHGGAYVSGINSFHFTMLTQLSDMTGRTVIMLDYPLPPDTGPQEIIDCAALHYDAVMTEFDGNVILGGDSAGGHLALGICQTRANVPSPVILLSPWTDLSQEGVADVIDDYDVLLDPAALCEAGARFAGALSLSNPLVSPIHIADFSTLPSLHIYTGEKDVLHSAILKFSETAKQAGRLGKLAIYGAFGHWWMFYPTPDKDDVMLQLAKTLQVNKAGR